MGFEPTTLWLRVESTNHYTTVLQCLVGLLKVRRGVISPRTCSTWRGSSCRERRFSPSPPDHPQAWWAEGTQSSGEQTSCKGNDNNHNWSTKAEQLIKYRFETRLSMTCCKPTQTQSYHREQTFPKRIGWPWTDYGLGSVGSTQIWTVGGCTHLQPVHVEPRNKLQSTSFTSAPPFAHLKT